MDKAVDIVPRVIGFLAPVLLLLILVVVRSCEPPKQFSKEAIAARKAIPVEHVSQFRQAVALERIASEVAAIRIELRRRNE